MVTIFFLGKYPGHGAAANRIRLYQKGLIENGVSTEIISFYKPAKGRLAGFVQQQIIPFTIFFKLINLSKETKIVFAYKFFFTAWFAIWLGTRIRGLKLVFEMNEKPFMHYNNRFSELKWIKLLNVFLFERISAKLSDGYVVISENLGQYVKKIARKAIQIIKVPIIIDPAEMVANAAEVDLQKPFLLHAGALSDRKDGIIGVLEAFVIVNKELGGNLHFYLTQKQAPAEIHKLIEKITLEHSLKDRIHFLGIINQPQLLAYQQQCSMLILNKPDNEQNRYNFSTKLGEFLALGKPVIYTPIGEMNNYLKDGINAFQVPVNDPVKLAQIIRRIIANEAGINEIAAKGKALTELEFNFSFQGKRLADFFMKLTSA